MKKTINILFLSALMLTLGACSSSFLDRDPLGNTILQGQYDKLDNTIVGSMRGCYSLFYTVSDHDAFGKRSIDMYTDILSGDMALTDYRYGWFYTDEQAMSYVNRTGYTWGLYYLMLRNINKVIEQVSTKSEIINKVALYGLPAGGTLDVLDENDSVLVSFTQQEAEMAGYYAQALALRGYIYSQLAQLYIPQEKYLTSTTYNTELAIPVYDETNFDVPQPLSTAAAVYDQVQKDLEDAILYFEAFDEFIYRESKLRVDGDVAKGILAYALLNRANPDQATAEVNQNAYKRAAELAAEVINSGHYEIIPRKDLLTTGFNDVENSSWMWGQDVSVETAGGLASFFGQVDIHSYSYAWSGDTKAIDRVLYDSVLVEQYPWDARRDWFRDKNDMNYALCADGKFFSAKAKGSTHADKIDRDWLSDNVYMRIESMYLIAAEANYRLGNDADAIAYLTAITDQRVSPLATDAEQYRTFVDGLNHSNLLQAIYDNWRIEMWGEGYGLQTFRRLGMEKVRGGNHSSDGGSKVQPSDLKYTFQIPSNEFQYNPAITIKL